MIYGQPNSLRTSSSPFGAATVDWPTGGGSRHDWPFSRLLSHRVDQPQPSMYSRIHTPPPPRATSTHPLAILVMRGTENGKTQQAKRSRLHGLEDADATNVPAVRVLAFSFSRHDPDLPERSYWVISNEPIRTSVIRFSRVSKSVCCCPPLPAAASEPAMTALAAAAFSKPDSGADEEVDDV